MKDFITHCGVPIFVTCRSYVLVEGPVWQRALCSSARIQVPFNVVSILRMKASMRHNGIKLEDIQNCWSMSLWRPFDRSIRRHTRLRPKAGSGYLMYHPTWEPPAILYTIRKLQGFPIDFEHASSFGAIP